MAQIKKATIYGALVGAIFLFACVPAASKETRDFEALCFFFENVIFKEVRNQIDWRQFLSGITLVGISARVTQGKEEEGNNQEEALKIIISKRINEEFSKPLQISTPTKKGLENVLILPNISLKVFEKTSSATCDTWLEISKTCFKIGSQTIAVWNGSLCRYLIDSQGLESEKVLWKSCKIQKIEKFEISQNEPIDEILDDFKYWWFLANASPKK